MASLSIEQQKKIDDVIDGIRLRTGLSYPDDDLLQITDELGVDVYFIDFEDFDENIDGLIDYTDRKNPKIYINETFSKERKTFTLAHELGHYFLHDNEDKKYRVDTFDYSQDTKESIEESEANYFAASLLVPKEKLTRLLTITQSDIESISKYFGVSKPVIETRIKWLKTN